MENVLVIGIAGGTGSGKTTLMKNIIRRFDGRVTVMSHDNYYKRHDSLTYEERSKLNYDEPDAFDTSLMAYHLEELRQGRAVDCPVYDFTVHNRTENTVHLEPAPVIIVEGILIFENQELRDLMEYDELELDTLGDQKTALFVILSDTDSTFNFVAALMYSQLFNLLCDKADDFYGGRLPVHVRLILDEFANIGQIPNFDKLIATIRSREISASIILQSQSQLKTIYKDAADTIVGNCDSTLFLGGKEKSTLKEISELLGKETIDLYNQSENRGSQVSHGLSYQKLGKELMTQDELAVMDGGKCIFMLRGVRPFLSDKYDLTRHPNYRYTADADPKNVFDMERYMKKQRAVVKPTDTFDVYEIDATT